MKLGGHTRLCSLNTAWPLYHHSHFWPPPLISDLFYSPCFLGCTLLTAWLDKSKSTNGFMHILVFINFKFNCCYMFDSITQCFHFFIEDKTFMWCFSLCSRTFQVSLMCAVERHIHWKFTRALQFWSKWSPLSQCNYQISMVASFWFIILLTEIFVTYVVTL